MGYTLTKYALGRAADPKMSNATRVVLIALAYHAIDATGRYRQGHGYLALVLGHGADPDAPAAKRAVSRCIRDLIEMGVIEVERDSAPRQTRAYRFTHVAPPDDEP